MDRHKGTQTNNKTEWQTDTWSFKVLVLLSPKEATQASQRNNGSLNCSKALENLVGTLIKGLLFSMGVLMFSTLGYYAEMNEDSRFGSIPGSFWWAIITMTTVGYGDVFPVTILGKIIASFCAVSGKLWSYIYIKKLSIHPPHFPIFLFCVTITQVSVQTLTTRGKQQPFISPTFVSCLITNS